MARRTTPAHRPERPRLSVDEKRQAIVFLNRRIADLEAFDPSSSPKRFEDPQVIKIQTSIQSTLQSIFGAITAEYHRYSSAIRLDNGPVSMSLDWGDVRRGYGHEPDFRGYLAEGKAQAIALLQQAVRDLEEEIEFSGAGGAIAAEVSAAPELSRKIFIVHGHDDGAREAVARYVQDLGFEPVILHEQANRGSTVIEKIESNADVGFAVVLLTPDDVGSVRGAEELEPRARQNVLLELGYFLARLGRSNVCALKKGEVAIPSDFAGVVWEQMDAGHGWKVSLGRELRAAGFQVDLNKALG